MIKRKFKKILSTVLAVIIALSSLSIASSAFNKLVEGDTYNVTQKATKYLYPLYWGSAPTVPSLADRGWEAVFRKNVESTGEPAYCLEFGKEFSAGNTVCIDKLSSSAYSGLSPVSVQGITLSTIYGYPNYTYGVPDDAAYAATQMLIWEFQQVYRTGIKYGDPAFGIEGGTDNQDNLKARFYNGIKFKGYTDVMTAYEGIINAMSNHWLLPSFITTPDSTQLLFNAGTGYYEKTFVDTNGVLPEFDVTSDSGNLVLFANGNELTVKSKSPIAKDITEKLTLNKKIGKNDTATLLDSQGHPDYQKLLCGTIADPVVGNFDVWTGIGKLNITKTAEDNMINGVKFNVKSDVTGYNHDFVTDVNGKIQITNLDVGVEYIVSEIDSTGKYIIPSAKRIVLNDTPMDISFNNLLARGNLTINKFDAVTKKPIEDTNFSVFSGTEKVEENFITLLSTKADGTASVLNLPCGVYTIFEVAPAIGYRKDNTPKTVTVKQDETTIVDWANYAEIGYLEINKTDATNANIKLQGVKFNIYADEDVGTFYKKGDLAYKDVTTDANGYLKVSLIPARYLVQETQTAVGYVLDSTKHKVLISDSDVPMQLNIENQKKTYHFKKVNAETNEGLRGVVLSFYDNNHNFMESAKTDRTGMAEFGKKIYIPNQTYYFVEQNGCSGYYPDYAWNVNTGKYDIQIRHYFHITEDGKYVFQDGTTYDNDFFVFKNNPTKFTILKKDAESKAPMENVSFELYDWRGQLITTLTTDVNGAISLNDYSTGDYYLKEIATKDEYVLLNKEIPFTIGLNTPKTLEIENTKNSMTLLKLDSVTKEPIKGTQFDLYNVQTGKVVGTYLTDENGEITVRGLLKGIVYYFVETKPTDGYYTDHSETQFYINELGQTINGADKVVDKLIINNSRTSFTIKKNDIETGKPLSGVQFDVYTINNVFVKTVETDFAGEVKILGLTQGDYYAVEKLFPVGYIQSAVKHWFTIGPISIREMTVTNEMTKIELQKLDDKTNLPIENAKFALYDKATDTKIGDYVTDKNGSIVVKGLKVEGTYYFKETSPCEGYYSNDSLYTFIVDKNGELFVDSQKVEKIIATNTQTHFEIIKKDADTGLALPDVTFAVYDSFGTYVKSATTNNNGIAEFLMLPEGSYSAVEVTFPTGYTHDATAKDFKISLTDSSSMTVTNKKTSVILAKVDTTTGEKLADATIEIYDNAGEKVYTGVTDSEGIITVNYLPVGTYSYKETIAPDGYQLNTETLSFTINEDGTITNGYAIENTPTEVVITKVNEDDEPLFGAVIAIYNSVGEEVFSGTTDEFGQVKAYYLGSGEYTYKEIKAPDGYKLNEEVYSFTIDHNGYSSDENVIVNTSTNVTITKTDEKDVPLKGSRIGIYDSEGELLYEDVTDEFGKISISGLFAGDYTYKELENPDGFILDKKTYSFSIDEKGAVSGDKVLVNKATIVTITKTDKDGKAVENATIGVYDEKDTLLFSATTDKNGQIIVKGLKAGNYYFKEILPASGYELNDSKVTFTVAKDGSVTGNSTLVNNLTKVVINKSNTDGKPLEGAKIGVYDVNDIKVFEGYTDKNGQLVVEGLKAGSYYAKEIEAPKGYQLSEEKVNFTINDYGVCSDSVLITNQLMPEVIVEIPKTGVKTSVRIIPILTAIILCSSTTLCYSYVNLKMKKKEQSM